MAMKYFLLFSFLFCGCYHETTGDAYYAGSVYTVDDITIVYGDLIFYCTDTYNYGSHTVSTRVVNNSQIYTYAFDYEVQLYSGGLVDSSGISSIFGLQPGFSEGGASVYTRYNNFDIRIVLSNVVRTRYYSN